MSKPQTGYFVDWNGDTRSIANLGGGYSCTPLVEKVCEGKPYQAVDILDAGGFVIFEAVYYPTLDDIKALGVTVNLV